MLLLVVAWATFLFLAMRKGSPGLTEMRRHNEVLEKILASHEARLQKLEEGKDR